MSYFQKVVDFFFSRRMLALLALVLLAAAVWFIGPLLGFGVLHPLAGVAMRVTVIVMLLALLLCLLLQKPVSLVGIAALCLLLWHAGPLLTIGEMKPLAPAWVRELLIVAVVLCYAAFYLYRRWHAIRADKALLRKFLRGKSKRPGRQAAALHARILAVVSAVAAAVQQLKQMRNTGGVRRLFEGRRYLYELPWYMVIGSAGAGKTSAILNSGMQFPLAEQMGASVIKARNGTENCNWWFTNDSVLIDTAGRYTEQDEQTKPELAAANAAEWRVFLGQLRKYRPRAPINGALLTVSVADLLGKSPVQRTALAAAMRARLAELRSQLGIRFPVYVVLTKLDLLSGFAEYFQTLSAVERAQVWGFTLPYRKETLAFDQDGLRTRCEQELQLLEQRLERGVNQRIVEEYEYLRRRKLHVLPQEFRSLTVSLAQLLEQVFLDSRYDNTQLHTTLRGVYFTSAAQAGKTVAADRSTLSQRFHSGVARANNVAMVDDHAAPGSGAGRSYFLHNLFQQLIIPESHLVRPNMRWELRFRLLRTGGHLLSIAFFIWLLSALALSFNNNHHYLAAVDSKTKALAAQVAAFRKAPSADAVPAVLNAAQALPQYKELDLEHPGGSYRYGLYTAPGVAATAQHTYVELQRQLLLPRIVKRIDTALAAEIDAGNADAVYSALTVYLMLYEQNRFNGDTVKTWVLRDWERADSAAAFGDRAAMVKHLDLLLADGPWIAPAAAKNEDLVQRARAFLNSNPVSSRLYERAKAAMEKEAPENFTLARAIGPQTSTVLTMTSASKAQEHGVPGLYTYDGYHQVFNQRLAEFVGQAQAEDAWVMGRNVGARLASAASGKGAANAGIIDDIRRQYLTDYGNYWQQFLEDIRPLASSADSSSGSLALDVQTLRILAAPDSPLSRLARAVSRETSLSVPAVADDSASSTLADMALGALEKKSSTVRTANTVGKTLNLRQGQKLEKELVDNRFAALREVVTGQADTGSGPALTAKTAAAGDKGLQLDAIIGLLNEQYTLLVVADNALSTNNLPPAADIGAKLRMESAKLPAPFKAVLAGVAERTTDKINQGVGALLSAQMEASIGNACRSAIEGKYPFVASQQEVDIEDFARVFAAGGLLDDFFQKNLAGHVDTNSKPWRYKTAGSAAGAMHGPDLGAFQRAAMIREVFFRDPGAKRLSWKMDVKVASLDPEITQLAIDIDGQSNRYAHGPVLPFTINWPGPRGGAMAEISANPRVRPDTSSVLTNGPWALFRLLERGRIIETASASRLAVDFTFDGRHAVLDLVTGGLPNPFTSNLLKDFHCPTSVA
ncbi:type VI secretion system membrane subunit TssM [Paraherbaspirillum soli]|uniref:Type VI secretion system membrane subunit TssM n=1 Tax=Paraherbaspirillum soli TaxID=631222 RepID=A0ABW0M6L8_9BURK